MKKFIFFLCCICAFQISLAADMMNPNVCKSCHEEQYKDWKTSLHALSHEDSNELYRKAVTWAANENHKLYDDQLLECGQCHNPKMQVKKMDADMFLATALNIDTQKSQQLQEAINADDIKTGVSCYICHNVSSIKPKTDPKQSGYKLFDWTLRNIIVGPYDIESTLFHANEHRDFFRENDNLCLSCHQGQATQNKFSVYNTGVESADAEKRCVDCHMGSLRTEIIAPTIKRDDMTPREVKSHFFKGARNSDILKEALDFDLVKIGENEAKLSVQNLISHNVPTGFGGRSMVFEISFFNNAKLLDKQNIDFRAIFKNATMLETFSYGATSMSSDTRLKPFERRDFKITTPNGTNKITINVVYYVIAPQLQELLQIKSESHIKPYKAMQKEFKF